jgi:hypothetical protein
MRPGRYDPNLNLNRSDALSDLFGSVIGYIGDKDSSNKDSSYGTSLQCSTGHGAAASKQIEIASGYRRPTGSLHSCHFNQ